MGGKDKRTDGSRKRGESIKVFREGKEEIMGDKKCDAPHKSCVGPLLALILIPLSHS